MRVDKYHEERIKRVCDYINNHLDEDMSLEKLSIVAICSKYHFHRIFKSFMGLSTIQFVLLARMKRASFRLAFEPEKSIIDIAYEANFESPEAFSRAFRRIFKQSPSQFRNNPEWQSWHSKYESGPPIVGENIVDIKVINFEEKKVALIEHKGDPKLVFDTTAKFIAWRKETGLSPIKKSDTFLVFHITIRMTLQVPNIGLIFAVRITVKSLIINMVQNRV